MRFTVLVVPMRIGFVSKMSNTYVSKMSINQAVYIGRDCAKLLFVVKGECQPTGHGPVLRRRGLCWACSAGGLVSRFFLFYILKKLKF